MNRTEVIHAIIRELESQLATAMAASRQAAEMATDEESKAETKWDTQGLEASYLAAGQAGQARSLGQAVQTMKTFLEDLPVKLAKVAAGSLVECELGGGREWFFLSPVGGGIEVEADNALVTVITLQAPLGSRILGLRAGGAFTLPNGSKGMLVQMADNG